MPGIYNQPIKTYMVNIYGNGIVRRLPHGGQSELWACKTLYFNDGNLKVQIHFTDNTVPLPETFKGDNPKIILIWGYFHYEDFPIILDVLKNYKPVKFHLMMDTDYHYTLEMNLSAREKSNTPLLPSTLINSFASCTGVAP